MTANEQPTEIREADDPYTLFAEWMGAAESSEPNDANAMSLATVGADGMPSVRMVLLKGVDGRGFVFYTNSLSAKGAELAANPKAGLCFHWKSLRRQVRVRGDVEQVTDAEADGYFASRPRGAQVGAWASIQSSPMPQPGALRERIAEFEARFQDGEVPRPPHWLGYRVVPQAIEFWLDRPFRLHDRLLYRRDGTAWTTARLYP